MKRVHVFDAAGYWTGRTYHLEDGDISLNLSEGEIAIDYVDHPHAKRLVDGVLEDFVPEPPGPADDFEWVAEDRRHRLKPEAARRLADLHRAKTRIAELETAQARAIREQAIGRGGTPAELKQRLEAIDDEITALRATLNK